VRDCLADSLNRINQHLPPGQPQARQNQLGQNNMRVEMLADPGVNYRVI
jgi:hypothetical protein